LAKKGVKVHGFWVLLGRSGSEPLPDARDALYRWIGGKLRPAGVIERRGPTQSLSLSFDEVQKNAACIRELLLAEKVSGEGAVVIIDLSETPYDLLREPFLLYVGETARELAQKAGRSVLIALPGRAPATSSLLWTGLGGEDGRGEGSIHVVDQYEEVEMPGIVDLPAGFSNEYRKRASMLDTKTKERLKTKLLRRLGHFDLAALGGPEEVCSHYLYDAANCVDELATLIERRMSSMIGRGKNKRYMLIPCSGHSDWLQEAAMLAGDRIDVKVGKWPKRPTKITPKELRGHHLVLLFDIVRSGKTARAVLARAAGWEEVKVKVAWTAIGPRTRVRNLPGGLKLDVAEQRTLERVNRKECPQCQLGLAFTPPERDGESHRLRAFDLWSMLRDVSWRKEEYGPPNAKLFKSGPDFHEVFERYGDFFAYRYERALRPLGDNEVIIASPDEPAVGALLRRLKARFEDRVVLIAIPRKAVLGPVGRDGSRANVEKVLKRHRAQPWARQLENARSREEDVVMVDEFNASGATARAMADLLRGAGVGVTRFMPVVDRKPRIDIGIPITPLYEIPSPR
jgi:hypothetical protein